MGDENEKKVRGTRFLVENLKATLALGEVLSSLVLLRFSPSENASE